MPMSAMLRMLITSPWQRLLRACGNHRARGCSGNSFDQIENRGDKKDADGAGRRHSSDHGGAHDLAGDGTGSAGCPEGNASKDECERGHQNWTEAQARTLQGSFGERLSFFELVLGELDDEDCIFRRK